MHLHDITTPKKTQYHSVIYYEKGNIEELQVIKKTMEEVAKEGKYPGYPAKIVTEVKELGTYYPAEEHHQNYFNTNPSQSYCQTLIKPKLGKLQELFK